MTETREEKVAGYAIARILCALKSTAAPLHAVDILISNLFFRLDRPKVKRYSLTNPKGGWDILCLTSLFEGEERTLDLFLSFVRYFHALRPFHHPLAKTLQPPFPLKRTLGLERLPILGP